MANLLPDFGRRVRRMREALGYTQGQLAAELGVTLLTVHRWEAGKSRPHPASRRRLEELEARLAAPAPSMTGGDAFGRPDLDFGGRPDAIAAFAEALYLRHGHEFNPTFAVETARIDPLPHQRIAVYEHMLRQDPLRFLLADDAGAGKTIMTGLLVRELLLRDRIRRVLIVPPAGLVGNWERELRTLFRLRFRIYRQSGGGDNPFRRGSGDRLIVSVDTLRQKRAFASLAEPGVPPYDLVVFDEAHKLSVHGDRGGERKTRRYQLAEALAGGARPAKRFAALEWSPRHLLLLTATPHMGRDEAWHALWRLLDARAFPTPEAVRRTAKPLRDRHFLRRTKEEMVAFDGKPLYLPRHCDTLGFDLSAGERDLYERTTAYLRDFYDRAFSNRPAVELALSVFQRRLVSSTWALLRSFERRIAKLGQVIRAIESGETAPEALGGRQLAKAENFVDVAAADEEVFSGGREENEIWEEEILGALAETTRDGLRHEVAELTGLREAAARLHEAGDESKFVQLRRVIEDDARADQKWLIFSEHRDTVEYLVRRLEGLGYAGRIAEIHGGMGWPERDRQVERFRDEAGARFLIATDAAGEGINLQFCHLMVNYDIPWNPARLEQRMGRIHRYRQKHAVRIVNLVSNGTREGRVLRVLLEKLEAIRTELTSDKVFDVVGRMLQNQSLRGYMRGLVTTGDESGAVAGVEASVTPQAVEAIRAREAEACGSPGDVAGRLPELGREMERAKYVEQLPARVRALVERSAPLLDIRVDGNLDGAFRLRPRRVGALDALAPALEALPPRDRERLSVRPLAEGEPGVWLHPGEAVCDALADLVRVRFGRDALRGAIFSDTDAENPYFLYVALVDVEEELPVRASRGAPEGLLPLGSPDARRLRERRLLALRQRPDGRIEEAPVELLLLLEGEPQAAPGAIPLAGRSPAMRDDAAAHVTKLGREIAEEHRETARREAAARRFPLEAGFDLRAAELSRQRKKLRRSRASDPEEVAQVRRAQAALAEDRRLARHELHRTPDRIHAGAARILVHALVIPSRDPTNPMVEAKAVRVATAWERGQGGEVEDVSTPAKARAAGLPDWPGFDLRSTRPNGTKRLIEVKGRAAGGGVQLAENEWTAAMHHRRDYWVYAVLDCATPRPRLYRVPDPWRTVFPTERALRRYTIPAGSLVGAAEAE